MYDSDESNDCNPNENVCIDAPFVCISRASLSDTAEPLDLANPQEEILQHNENIYYNYLAQFASILPKQLVLNLNTTVQAQLEGDDGPEAESMRQQLEEMWKQASVSYKT